MKHMMSQAKLMGCAVSRFVRDEKTARLKVELIGNGKVYVGGEANGYFVEKIFVEASPNRVEETECKRTALYQR